MSKVELVFPARLAYKESKKREAFAKCGGILRRLPKPAAFAQTFLEMRVHVETGSRG